jgi:hypothetical protein
VVVGFMVEEAFMEAEEAAVDTGVNQRTSRLLPQSRRTGVKSVASASCD